MKYHIYSTTQNPDLPSDPPPPKPPIQDDEDTRGSGTQA